MIAILILGRIPLFIINLDKLKGLITTIYMQKKTFLFLISILILGFGSFANAQQLFVDNISVGDGGFNYWVYLNI